MLQADKHPADEGQHTERLTCNAMEASARQAAAAAAKKRSCEPSSKLKRHCSACLAMAGCSSSKPAWTESLIWYTGTKHEPKYLSNSLSRTCSKSITPDTGAWFCGCDIAHPILIIIFTMQAQHWHSNWGVLSTKLPVGRQVRYTDAFRFLRSTDYFLNQPARYFPNQPARYYTTTTSAAFAWDTRVPDTATRYKQHARSSMLHIL